MKVEIDRETLIDLLDNTKECWNVEFAKNGATSITEADMRLIQKVSKLLEEGDK